MLGLELNHGNKIIPIVFPKSKLLNVTQLKVIEIEMIRLEDRILFHERLIYFCIRLTKART